MNSKNLQSLFTKYIEQFEFINNQTNDENYKWAIARMFQNDFDLESQNFAVMLEQIWKGTSNLIDNARQLPFFALVDYARREPETVREMFRVLFQPDDGDLKARQARIEAFLAQTEVLRMKYFPDSWKYKNDQRSVMAYLFLHDPDENYLYKSTQAHEFADCVEFYDDWGSGGNFKLDIYYRMCDELVKAMREYEPLMKTHRSRFDGHQSEYFEDRNLHILAFDMIYTSQVYGLYNGIPYAHPNTQEKKLYLERMEKARSLQAEYDEAEKTAALLENAIKYLQSALTVGHTVTHKVFGAGTVAFIDSATVVVEFNKVGEKKFMLMDAFGKGFLSANEPELNDYIKQHLSVMVDANGISRRLKSAELALEPYIDILN